MKTKCQPSYGKWKNQTKYFEKITKKKKIKQNTKKKLKLQTEMLRNLIWGHSNLMVAFLVACDGLASHPGGSRNTLHATETGISLPDGPLGSHHRLYLFYLLMVTKELFWLMISTTSVKSKFQKKKLQFKIRRIFKNMRNCKFTFVPVTRLVEAALILIPLSWTTRIMITSYV